MKKVAIMTINSINYGNRLQNYALQEIVRSFEFEVETIRRTKNIHQSKKVRRYLKGYLRELKGTREGLFHRFDRKYIKFSKYSASPNEVSDRLDSAYDFFVAGSDQIWNPHFGHIVGTSDLLSFVKDKKKIAYAASIGVDEIPEDQLEKFKHAWERFDALSVREREAAKIIRACTGREAEVLLDPTLLFDAEWWARIENRPACMPKGNYILEYRLGKVSEQINNYLAFCQSERAREVLSIMEKGTDGRRPAVGPAEFLYLIHHADMVVTDSFHALAFSSIFHTPVKVFPRAGIDMSSRIVSFAETVGLEHHFSNDGVFAVESGEDFAAIDECLKAERIQSSTFLKTVLKN